MYPFKYGAWQLLDSPAGFRLNEMTLGMTNLTLSTLIIEKLIGLGVEHFVISPGSRSTPLTVAAARNGKAGNTVHYDERGAAFFALGVGKATGKPAALICTSGTAVANYFPAIVEASMDNVPLIVLSADRPPELIGVGANQAIYQKNIYGRYPRWATDLHPPDETTDPVQMETLLESMWDAATRDYPGPVHLNCQFREPFFGPDQGDSVKDGDGGTVAAGEITDIASKLSAGDRGLVIVGRGISSEMSGDILRVAEKLNWPVFPDVQSDLRFTVHPNVISHHDLVLLKDEYAELKPAKVLHLGGPFTSKRLLNYLEHTDPFYIQVKETPERVDPNHQVDLAMQIDLPDLLSRLEKELPDLDNDTGLEWLTQWQEAGNTAASISDDMFINNNILSEPAVCHSISALVPADHTLFLANSMPIRDMEMFGQTRNEAFQVMANRGASGIDGLFATACGVAKSSKKPLTMVIGDLASLHDLNSLSLISKSDQPIVVILLNNQGGGIFNFLPITEQADVFERYFGTPHTWQFQKAAEMFSLEYHQPSDMGDFRSVYEKALKTNKSTLIEVKSDRYDNHCLHRDIFQKIRES